MAKIKSVIGFEVDSMEIRAVELAKNNNGYAVLACGKVALPDGVIEEGFVRDADTFSVKLNELLQKGNFKSTNVVVGVNNENVIMRYASFPKVPSDKLHNMVLLQAQEFIPIPVQEMEIDYVVAGEGVNDEDQPIINVLLIAARQNMLEQFIMLLNAAKLQVIDIDSSALSYCRALSAITADHKYAFLNLTDSIMTFLVIQGDEISMVRSISVPERSQQAVTEYFSGTKNGEISEENFEEVASLLASETASSVSYYTMQNMEHPIEKIYFVTDAGKAQELAERIEQTLYTIPVEVPKFYEKENFGLSQGERNEFASCIGLAMQALEG